ncbi:hypothetical protein XENOCAPTIV_019010, partial [Xenoophorus captivus]
MTEGSRWWGSAAVVFVWGLGPHRSMVRPGWCGLSWALVGVPLPGPPWGYQNACDGTVPSASSAFQIHSRCGLPVVVWQVWGAWGT